MKNRTETGYDKRAMRDAGLSDEDEETFKCIDCSGEAKATDFECIIAGRIEYICEECYEKHGPSNNKTKVPKQTSLFRDFESTVH